MPVRTNDRIFNTVTITYPNMVWQSVTQTYLPSSEPNDPQFSWTINSGHLPTVSPEVRVRYSAFIVITGKNGEGTSQYLNYSVWKNGQCILTGFESIGSGAYYVLEIYVRNVNTGDVVAVKLWSSNSGMYYDHYVGFRILVLNLCFPELLGKVLRLYFGADVDHNVPSGFQFSQDVRVKLNDCKDLRSLGSGVYDIGVLSEDIIDVGYGFPTSNGYGFINTSTINRLLHLPYYVTELSFVAH